MDRMGWLTLVCLVLFTIQSSITQNVKRCDVPADVIFLMDASESIKDSEWIEVKNFVTVLIDNLEVARSAIHVGVIVYSSQIGLVIDLQPFKTKQQLKDLLGTAVKLNTATDTAEAIRKMIEMSDSQGRIELDAKQIGVIITDGRSNNVPSTIRDARRARTEFGIDMIALGIGNETFYEELEQITGPENTNRLFQVQNFEQLKNVDKQLEEIICEIVPSETTTTTPVPTTTSTTLSTTSPFIPPFPCSDPADIVFLIDGSYSIKAPDWTQGKQFVSYMINSLDVGIQSSHVGIVVYGTEIGDVVPLVPFKGKTDLRTQAAGLIQPDDGKTNTALGIRLVRNMLSASGRTGVPHIAIVITDGESDNAVETAQQASEAKAEGITIFVVGVGDRVLRQELQDIATSQETLFESPDFTTLISLVENLRNQICEAIKSTTTPTPTTTTPPPIPDLCMQCLVEGGVGFNPLPGDCEKYVMCLPVGQTYEPNIKTCPFGLFWSSEAVSCLDSRYVECPYDKCMRMISEQTYSPATGNCRSYYRCSNSRSSPVCCEQGYRYVEGFGCNFDPSCNDPCPLDITIFNQGACDKRPNLKDVYSFYKVIPGQGQRMEACPQGQVYSDKDCSCTFDAGKVVPEIACTAAVNLTFDGRFEDKSANRQPVEVKGVGITNNGNAYFNGNSYLTLPGTANMMTGDKFVIRMTYRIKDDSILSEQIWNNHWDWGFQEWFNNASSNGNPFNVIKGDTQVTAPDYGSPQGADSKPLEVITISKDGTVVRDPTYDTKVNVSWPGANLPTRTVLNLGDLATLTSPTIRNGIVYVPSGTNNLLIQEPVSGVSGVVTYKWRVVSIDSNGRTGSVVESGEGDVPLNIQQKYSIDLRAPLIETWYILAPGGLVLQDGQGMIPEEITNLYAGYNDGTLVKVFFRGDAMERWQISKPDGSQLQVGTGSIPQNLINQFSLNNVLGPAKVSAQTWAVLASDGTVLEQGTGTIPAGTINKYSNNVANMILTLSSTDGSASHWKMMRPSGVSLLEGRGALPDGVAHFVRGRIVIPQISTVSEWRVTMPDGSVRTGTGEIPQSILDLYEKLSGGSGGSALNQAMSATREEVPGGGVIASWSIFMPDGSQKRGIGPIPDIILSSLTGQTRWQITLPGGATRTGYGALPSDLLVMSRGQASGSSGSFGSSGSSGLSGSSGSSGFSGSSGSSGFSGSSRSSGSSGFSGSSGSSGLSGSSGFSGSSGLSGSSGFSGSSGSSGGSISGSSMQKMWSVTMPDGTVRSGVGEMPADLAMLVQGQGQGGGMQKTWEITMPDGSVRRGTGEMPADLAKLIQGQGQGGGMQKTWEITMPDGSVRRGTGEMPADLANLVQGQGQGAGMQKNWEITMPDGNVRRGTGEIPMDLQRLIGQAGKKRRRRAAHNVRVNDLLSNCGYDTGSAPSIHMFASHKEVGMTLATSNAPNGVTVTVPAHVGKNEVIFMYDGVQLTGMANGYVARKPLSGLVVPKPSPVMLGQCMFRNQNYFMGEIDQFAMFHCLP